MTRRRLSIPLDSNGRPVCPHCALLLDERATVTGRHRHMMMLRDDGTWSCASCVLHVPRADPGSAGPASRILTGGE